MILPNDFKEFIELLNEHNVQYLIVGGYAVGFHSRPKFTHDIDFWIEPCKTNAQKLIQVLKDFGFTDINLTVDDLSVSNKLIQLGNEPMRIDIMTSVSGLQFDNSFRNKVIAKYLGVEANFVNIDDLIINKKASGRKNDLFDIEWIEQYRKNE